MSPESHRQRLAWTSALLVALTACGHPDEGTVVDTSHGRTGDGGPSGDTDDTDDTDDEGPGKGGDSTPDACARAELDGARVVPTVWLLVDGSGSMGTAMTGAANGASRWSVLREALLDDSAGILAKLEGSVAFGLFVYDGGLSPPGVKTDLCPRVVEVAPALDNLSTISTAYPLFPLGASTPTNYALLELSKKVKSTPQQGPTYVVLATDGKPNICDFHDGVAETLETERQAVMTVSQLKDKDIKTFAISMAEGDAALTKHLEDVAKAGGTGEPVFTPTTSDGLTKALSKTLEGTRSCDVKLEGKIAEGRECAGEVTINGSTLQCNDKNGFRVKDDFSTLELLGSACETLLHDAKATLKANFPCDYIELF